MGWKTPKILEENWLNLTGSERYFYTHDYALLDIDSRYVKMTHESKFNRAASAIQDGSILGFQFHPERSLKFGENLLQEAVRELNK